MALNARALFATLFQPRPAFQYTVIAVSGLPDDAKLAGVNVSPNGPLLAHYQSAEYSPVTIVTQGAPKGLIESDRLFCSAIALPMAIDDYLAWANACDEYASTIELLFGETASRDPRSAEIRSRWLELKQALEQKYNEPPKEQLAEQAEDQSDGGSSGSGIIVE